MYLKKLKKKKKKKKNVYFKKKGKTPFKLLPKKNAPLVSSLPRRRPRRGVYQDPPRKPAVGRWFVRSFESSFGLVFFGKENVKHQLALTQQKSQGVYQTSSF